jgi:hypothetical protein
VSVPVVARAGGDKSQLWPVSGQNPAIVTSAVAESPRALDETNAVVLAALNFAREQTDCAEPAGAAAHETAVTIRRPLRLRRKPSQETSAPREISLADLVPQREAAKIARENELYRSEIIRLNEVYTAEIDRLTRSYSAEITRLNDALAGSIEPSGENEIYRNKIEYLHRFYRSEIARLNETSAAEDVRLNDVCETETGRSNAEISRLTEASASATAQTDQTAEFQLYANTGHRRSVPMRFIRAAWRLLPLGIRRRVLDSVRARLHAARARSPESIRRRSVQLLARLLPATVRNLLRVL